jgi:aminodeoxyfutalosine synthase
MLSTTHPFQTDDAALTAIHDKVLATQHLDLEDVTALYASKDILALGWLANFVRERAHGQATRYNVDQILLSQPAAAGGCPLCGRPPQTVDIVLQVERAAAVVDEFIVLLGATGLSGLLRSIETLKKNWPQVPISALTAEEITSREWQRVTDLGNVRRYDTLHAPEVCASLRQAGADGLIGSGAEVFVPILRHRLWHHAGTAQQRAHARQAARAAGLGAPSFSLQSSENSSSPRRQAEDLLSFRDQPADRFAALTYAPDNTTSLHVPVTTGMQEMKQIAIARLVLDNVAHIRTYWEMLGGKLLQIALRFGASDLDGTPLADDEKVEERAKELAREIQVAGREPQAAKSIQKLVLIA